MSFFWRLTCSATLENIEIFADAIEEHVLSVGWFETTNPEIWMVEATVRKEPEMAFLQQLISEAAAQHKVPSPHLHVEKLPDADWLEQTWKNFPPLEIARFYIYGSHAKGEIPEGLIGMEINAATAFGSGEHQTTTGCLETLCDFMDAGIQVKNPLDMGCGSGVLAMAVTKLWQMPVLAVDNDPESVRVAAQNAATNKCEQLMHTLCNEGFEGDVVQKYGPFDLIVANILAGPLCDMAPQMVANTIKGGRIVLSGLLTRQIDEVAAAYEVAGATLVSVKNVGDWATLSLIK
ncbi:50S ribosomal protein L11 methyltransferase [Candidatus Paracaedibacter symbiosus]|uniref:50S ribosomal protein L11 methyltransferase n=1 Tax=Candidatus Paracaedibacter symbiosus TaxID=244582 RepID=UPI0006894F26|nr:50S ribosomal protein L11 methyltransferase [Candidatus Paracaedibacter symbiosus]